MASLGGTLEEMRRRLLALTSELERREAEARAVLAGVVEGVLAVDGERRITYLNPQAERLLGTPTDAARGRFCGDVLGRRASDGVLSLRRPLPAGARPLARHQPRRRVAAAARRQAARVLTTSAPSGGPGQPGAWCCATRPRRRPAGACATSCSPT